MDVLLNHLQSLSFLQGLAVHQLLMFGSKLLHDLSHLEDEPVGGRALDHFAPGFAHNFHTDFLQLVDLALHSLNDLQIPGLHALGLPMIHVHQLVELLDLSDQLIPVSDVYGSYQVEHLATGLRLGFGQGQFGDEVQRGLPLLLVLLLAVEQLPELVDQLLGLPHTANFLPLHLINDQGQLLAVLLQLPLQIVAVLFYLFNLGQADIQECSVIGLPIDGLGK